MFKAKDEHEIVYGGPNSRLYNEKWFTKSIKNQSIKKIIKEIKECNVKKEN